MADKGIETYLNDHLAGSVLGTDLAEQLEEMTAGTPRGEIMASLSAQIDEDKETLEELMERLGVSKNPVKQAGAWVAEKASRVKFSGLGAADDEVGLMMAIESLRLGVEGKACLWIALKEVQDRYPELDPVELDTLLDRAISQRKALEQERISAARVALGTKVEAT